jgi:hypothetical protein
MTGGVPVDRQRLLDSSVNVPEHVVYRDFAQETVLLNLETGQYHGVNRSGGVILRILEQTGTVREAAAGLAERYGRDISEMQQDVCEFCSELLERGLMAVDEEP